MYTYVCTEFHPHQPCMSRSWICIYVHPIWRFSQNMEKVNCARQEIRETLLEKRTIPSAAGVFLSLPVFMHYIRTYIRYTISEFYLETVWEKPLHLCKFPGKETQVTPLRSGTLGGEIIGWAWASPTLVQSMAAMSILWNLPYCVQCIMLMLRVQLWQCVITKFRVQIVILTRV